MPRLWKFYSKLTEITQQMLLDATHAYVINRRDLDSSIRDGHKHACRRVCGFVYWTIIQVLRGMTYLLINPMLRNEYMYFLLDCLYF